MPARLVLRRRNGALVAAQLLALVTILLVGSVVVGGSQALADTAQPGPCPSGTGLDTGAVRLTAMPKTGSDELGVQHTVTATLTTSSGRPFNGACVQFDARSGSPSQNWPFYGMTAQDGTVTMTWTSTATGTDTVDIRVFDFNNTVIGQDTVTETWTQPPSGIAGGCSGPPRSGVTNVSASPASGTSGVGTSASVTATALSDGQPAAEVCIQFDQTSGPSTGWPRHAYTDQKGNASVTWSSSAAGTDVIVVSDVGPSGFPQHSSTVTHTWTAAPNPTPSPTASPTANPTPSPTPTRTPTPTRKPRPRPTVTRSPTPPPTSAPPVVVIPNPPPGPTFSVSPTPSPSPSALPIATPTPTVSSPPAAGASNAVVTLDRRSTLPGGAARVRGVNCPPSSAVTYVIGGAPAGKTTAGADGSFSGEVDLPHAIGSYDVLVRCGNKQFTVPIDLVVSSSTPSSPATATTAAAVLAFFVLLGALLMARPSSAKPAVVPVESDGPEEE